MIKLNETAAFLWEFFLKEHSEDEAVNALSETYEGDEATFREDVLNFMKLIKNQGFAE